MDVERCLQNVARPSSCLNGKVREWDSDPSGSDRLNERLELLDGFVVRLRAKERS
jgi:hypothetical protein